MQSSCFDKASRHNIHYIHATYLIMCRHSMQIPIWSFQASVQSAVFVLQEYLSTFVSSAPTGSGKTALIELAMIRILSSVKSEGKIIYMAPTKALCSQKAKEWSQKFKALGATCTWISICLPF